MSSLFDSFSATSKEEWVNLIHRELKGASADTLQKFNRVEEISMPAYFHAEDAAPAFSDPGVAPFTRGTDNSGNDWLIGSCFRIENEAETNTKILGALMTGTTSLVLHATNESSIDFGRLLNEAELEYIHTTFYPVTEDQAKAFASFTGNFPAAIVLPATQSWIDFGIVTPAGFKPFGINGYAVQQTGATTWQELAVALADGHDMLAAQLEAGLTVEQAAANIHFVFGVGNKYYFEIAKLRAFRTAWSKIIEAYEPADISATVPFITSKTGFVNISLKDPFTNLLRQTTEAMSAVLGGTDQLIIQPYDWFSSEPNLPFTQRMATNISLLLKEEAHLGIVADAAGGSYALDNLTNDIAERAWAEFRQIERNGGLSNNAVRLQLSQEIKEKANQRLQLVQEKQETLIGINAFPNPQTVENNWAEVPDGWNDLPSFIIEKHYQRP